MPDDWQLICKINYLPAWRYFKSKYNKMLHVEKQVTRKDWADIHVQMIDCIRTCMYGYNVRTVELYAHVYCTPNRYRRLHVLH